MREQALTGQPHPRDPWELSRATCFADLSSWVYAMSGSVSCSKNRLLLRFFPKSYSFHFSPLNPILFYTSSLIPEVTSLFTSGHQYHCCLLPDSHYQSINVFFPISDMHPLPVWSQRDSHLIPHPNFSQATPFHCSSPTPEAISSHLATIHFFSSLI